MRFQPGREGPLARLQGKVADGLEYFVRTVYQPMLAVALRWRYLTMAGFVGVLMLVLSTVFAGHIRFFPFPKVPFHYLNPGTGKIRKTLFAQIYTDYVAYDNGIVSVAQNSQWAWAHTRQYASCQHHDGRESSEPCREYPGSLTRGERIRAGGIRQLRGENRPGINCAQRQLDQNRAHNDEPAVKGFYFVSHGGL